MYSKVIQLYIHVYPFFQILFHYSLLQDIEYSSLCYTVNACCLSILYLAVCINPILPIYPSPPSPQRGIFARKVSSWNPRAGYLSRPMRVRMSHGTQAAICLSVCLSLAAWLPISACLCTSVTFCLSVRLPPPPIRARTSWLPLHHVTFRMQSPRWGSRGPSPFPSPIPGGRIWLAEPGIRVGSPWVSVTCRAGSPPAGGRGRVTAATVHT